MTLRVALGLGANLGGGRAIDAALRELADSDSVLLLKVSALYSSPPWGDAVGGQYVNAVALIDSALNPWALMRRCLQIEHNLGRVRGRRYAPRNIDIDLLCAPGVRVDTPRLCLPHPQLLKRRFALQPLCELAPDLVVAPGLRARAALQRCPDRAQLTRLQQLNWATPLDSAQA